MMLIWPIFWEETIERADLDLNNTMNIIDKIFKGQKVQVGERDRKYKLQLESQTWYWFNWESAASYQHALIQEVLITNHILFLAEEERNPPIQAVKSSSLNSLTPYSRSIQSMKFLYIFTVSKAGSDELNVFYHALSSFIIYFFVIYDQNFNIHLTTSLFSHF